MNVISKSKKQIDGIINKSKEKPLIGFGTKADRRFTGMPVSNGYLYTLICGGFISLIALLVFLLSQVNLNLLTR